MSRTTSLRAVLDAVLATAGRNLRIARRRPDLVVQAAAVPVVVLVLAGIIFAADDAWPVAVVDEDGGPVAAEWRAALDDTAGVTGPYFDVVVTDPDEAARLVEAGRLHAAVRVPPGFSEDHDLEVTTYNVNTDAMKNVRLRLVQTANLADARAGVRTLGVDLRLDGPAVITRGGFMGGSAVVLALLLGATLITANLVALEQETRTGRELVLTPLGAATGLAGAMVSGVLLAVPAAVPTLVVGWLLGFRPDGAGAVRAAVVILPAMVAAAGVGVLLAHLLRTHRAIQPVIILAALAGWFATGGFVPVAGLPPAARAVSAVWPPSYVYEWTSPLLHGFADVDTVGAGGAVALLVGAVVGAAVTVWAGRREQGRPVLQGQ